MKLRLLVFAFVLNFLILCPVHAQDSVSLIPRCGQTDFDLCGYIDATDWKEKRETNFVIDPIFEQAKRFSEGLAAVRIDGKFGYINAQGQVVITPRFEKVQQFTDGIAIAGTSDILGVINRYGDFVIEPKFSHAIVFSEEIILAVSSENAERSRVNHSLDDISWAGLYSISEGWITEQKYNFKIFGPSELGSLWAQVSQGKRGNWKNEYGLMRIDGSWLIEPQFSYVEKLNSDRAVVRKMIDGKILYGAINSEGEQVIPIEFEYLTQWEEGFLTAGIGAYPHRRHGIVTSTGKLLAGRYFDKILRKNQSKGPEQPEHDFFTVKDGNQWKSLLKDGTLLDDQRIGQLFLQCENFKILYDPQGFVLIPNNNALPTVRFDRTLSSYSRQTCHPTPTLIRNDQYAVISDDGSIFGGFFENSSGFFGPHRWVSVNRKWGLVDAEGNFSIEPVYASVIPEIERSWSNSYPEMETDKIYKVIRDNQEYSLRFIEGRYKEEAFIETEKDRNYVLECRGAYKLKSQNGLWGIVDENDTFLIPANYRAITCFSRGVAWVPDDTKRKWCPIDRFNRMRSSPDCMTTYYNSFVSHHSPEEFDDDPYESSVLWMRALLEYGEGKRDSEPQFIPWEDR